MKPLFSPPRIFPKFIILIIFSTALMVADYRYHGLGTIHYYLGYVAYAIRHTAALPVGLWNQAHQHIFQMQQIKSENQALKQSNLRLSADLQKLKIIEQKNERLQALLGSKQHKKHQVVFAELVSADYSAFKQRVIINRGKHQGSYIGQAVLDARGIMGKIISVTPASATVMLISDPAHLLLAQIDRSGVRVLVAGHGNPHQLSLRHVPIEADVHEGDIVVTSGLDQHYPANYPIGYISRAHHPTNITNGVIGGVVRPLDKSFATVTLQPAAQLDRAREVLLIQDEPLSCSTC